MRRPPLNIPDAPVVELDIDGIQRSFDLDDPALPDWVKDEAFASDGYPYGKKLGRRKYEKTLYALQAELVKVLFWLQESGGRVMAVFEGRDAAGKGGTINAIRANLNPRHARVVALSKPSDTEQGQWYFQRYVDHFPTRGEIVLFDRSWYNRAGVEPVMGFCTPEQHAKFLAETPIFEKMITGEGIHFFKFWLTIGQEMQLKRFHDRRHDPVKVWKLSPIDIKALAKWDAYALARDQMFTATHSAYAPWTIVRSNDKRRARINVIRAILHALPYDGKDERVIGEIDPQIVSAPE
ncbi:MAG: polyphosphate kinase 2 [Nitratireductor sp.]|nr:polyphosphate kinase 2 [Nitratireductor sp.]